MPKAEHMEDILVAATPPIVAALIGALGFWLRRRSRTQGAQQALEAARSRIAVISAWLDAHKDLDPSGEHVGARKQALEDLEKTYSLIFEAELAGERERSESKIRPLVDAVFLLDSRPSSAVAKTVQIFYYASLAWVVLWIAAAFMFGLVIAITDTETTSGSFGERLGFSFGITVLCLAIGLAPALLLYLIFKASSDRPSPNR